MDKKTSRKETREAVEGFMNHVHTLKGLSWQSGLEIEIAHALDYALGGKSAVAFLKRSGRYVDLTAV